MPSKLYSKFTITFPDTATSGSLGSILTQQAREFSFSMPQDGATSRTLTVVYVETLNDDVATYIGTSSTSVFRTPVPVATLTLYDLQGEVLEATPLNQLTGVSAEQFTTGNLRMVMYRCVYTFLI